MVPEWVLLSDISHSALRLYAVLGLHADYGTGKTQILRRTLAKKMDCSVDTVDRAVKELLEIGALLTSESFLESKQEPNIYTVFRARPDFEPFPRSHPGGLEMKTKKPPGGRKVAATPRRTDAARGGRMDAAQNERDLEREIPEREEPSADAESEMVFDLLHVPVWETVAEIYGGPASKSERSDFAKTVIEIKEVLTAEAERIGVPVDLAAWAKAEIERRALSVDPAYRSHRSLRNRWAELGRKADPVEEPEEPGSGMPICSECEESAKPGTWIDEDGAEIPCPFCHGSGRAF